MGGDGGGGGGEDRDRAICGRGVGRRYRQRNSFSARAKHTTRQPAKTANSGPNCTSPVPCNMLPRNASIAAVNGSALITGCKESGKRCAEKNTPETIHIGIIVRF